MRIRKSIRIKGYDYSKSGYYFVTICTKNKRNILSKIYNYECNVSNVGVDAHIDPTIKLTNAGIIVEKHIIGFNERIKGVNINNYVIMPNHVHIIVELNCLRGDVGIAPYKPS